MNPSSPQGWPLTLAEVVSGLALACWGLLILVNNVAFLCDVGPQLTVHIEKLRDEQIQTSAWGHTAVVRYSDGYYLDASGQRISVSLHSNDLEPGMVVADKRSLIDQSHLPLEYGDSYLYDRKTALSDASFSLAIVVVGGGLVWMAASAIGSRL